jgi:hypothetical protein
VAIAADRSLEHGRRVPDLVGLLVVLAAAGALYVAWMDGVWMAADLGAYAHPAQRLLAGEVPARDFEDVHNAGYVHVVNALALALLGPDVLAIRWPLLAVVLVQAGMAYRWVLPLGRGWAALAGLSVGLMSPMLAPNPTANWYALVPALLVADRLRSLRGRPTARDLALLGFLAGMCFMLRQLSGTLLGVGLVSWLLIQAGRRDRDREAAGDIPGPAAPAPWAGRALMCVLLVGTVGYLLGLPHPGSVVLFAGAPVVLLAVGVARVRAPSSDVARLAGWLTLGGLLAVAPVLAYHAVHGSLGAWFHDTVLLAKRLADMPFNANEDYVAQLIYMFMAPFTGNGLAQVPVSLAWIGRLLLTPVLGGLALARVLGVGGSVGSSRGGAPRPAPDPVLWIALFYGIGAVHHEIPLYLLWALPPLLAAFHRELPRAPRAWRTVGLAWLAASAFVALRYDRPHTIWYEGAESVMAPRNHPRPEVPVFPGVGIKVSAPEADDYGRIVAVIHEHARPDESIFSFPTHPEFYVLAERRNATRYVFAGTSLYSEARVDSLIADFRRDPPAVILYLPRDKYNSPRTERLRAALAADYELFETRRGFEILVRADDPRTPNELP